MPGTLKVGGNIIASHTGVEGAGTVTLGNVVLGDSAVPTNNYTFRNKIINGNFDVWQRGTSFTLASSLYTTDRWIVANDSATVTASQSSDVPNSNSKYSLTISSTNYTNGFYQIIEDLNRYLDGKTYTLSAYVKGPAGKTFHMSIGWVADGEQYTFTGDWQFISRTITFPSNFSSTAGGSGNTYIHPIRWRTGDTISNLGVSDTIWITQVQFEEGSASTPFEQRSYGLELSLCQRYYEVMVIPGRGIHGHYSPNGGTSDAAAFHGFFTPFKQTKRITPTIPSVTSNSAWAILSYSNYSAQTTHTFRAQAISTEGFSPVANRVAGNNGPSIGSVYSWQTTVTYHIDAEIY